MDADLLLLLGITEKKVGRVLRKPAKIQPFSYENTHKSNIRNSLYIIMIHDTKQISEYRATLKIGIIQENENALKYQYYFLYGEA